jgi:hypothetical protein
MGSSFAMSTRFLILALFCTFLCALACVAPRGAATSTQRELGVSIVARGTQTGKAGTYIDFVYAEGLWKEIWKQHVSAMPVPPPMPRIDFKREMLVCVFLGDRPSAGFAVMVEGAELEGDMLTIRVVEQKPPEGSFQAQLVTRPFDIVRLERYDGKKRLEFVPPR